MKIALNGYRVSIILFVQFRNKNILARSKSWQKNILKKVKVKFNKDGTICAKLPLKALKLSIIERELSEEQRQEMSRKFKERMYKED